VTTGALTANGGTLDLNGNSITVAAFSGSASAVITDNSSSANATLTAGDSTSTSYAGQLTNGSNGKTLAFTKQGSGALTLSGTNTYSGGTTIAAGTVIMGNAAALGATTGNLALTAGTLDLNGNSLTVGTLSGNSGAVITSSTAGTITLAAGSSTTSAYAGVIQDGLATVTLAKSGTAILGLSGNNSYSGGTTISAGTIGMAGASGSNTNLGSGLVTVNTGGTLRVGYAVTSNTNTSTTANSISLNGGNIFADDANQHLTGGLDVTSLGGVLGSTYNAGNSTSAERDKGLAVDGVVTGSGAITVQHSRINTGNVYNTSFVSFSNNSNTFSGTITVSENTTASEGGVYLGVNGSTALANASIVLSANINGTNRKFGSSPLVFKTGLGSVNLGSLSGAANVVLTGYDEVNHTSGTDSIALTVGGNNATATYSGVLSGGGSLAKSGTGTFTLSGTNTYTGATAVNAGTLLVSGSISGSTTAVNSSGTLGGSGGTTGAVSVNSGGTLSPGAGSIGALNAGGDVTFNSGATFKLEIDTTTGSKDALAITGNLNLAATNDAVLTISDLTPASITSGSFAFITYTGAWNGGLFTYNGSAVADDSLVTVGSNQFTLDYNYNGNSVALLAVPEPNAFASLGAGFGVLLGLQRRRSRARGMKSSSNLRS